VNDAGANALAQALFRTAPAAVVALDVEGRVMMLNARAEVLLSASSEGAIGLPYQALLGASLSDRFLKLFLQSTRSADATAPLSIRATLPGGRRASLRASAGPIRDAGGAVTGVLFVADEELPSRPASPADAALESRLREALRRYLGAGIAAQVEARPSFIGVGGVRTHVSVLHADMRNYTTVAEALEPEATAALLLKYHGSVVEALQEQGATLDRFIGDSVLAIWNAPAPCEQHARAAIQGALAAQAAASRTGSELSYGIGVHTGDAVVGNVGNESFLNYTAVGDTVNVAARLQAAAGPGETVCSEAALEEAGGGVQTIALGPLTVKGRREPVKAYRLSGLEPDWSSR
jgi:class 3 adenylate cyclase